MTNIIPTTKNILVVAGDPSGDAHAANLIKALKAKDPELSVTSIGGVRMEEVSTHFIYNLVSVGAVGFAEPFKNFFLWLKLIRLVRRDLAVHDVGTHDPAVRHHRGRRLVARRLDPQDVHVRGTIHARPPGRNQAR